MQNLMEMMDPNLLMANTAQSAPNFRYEIPFEYELTSVETLHRNLPAVRHSVAADLIAGTITGSWRNVVVVDCRSPGEFNFGHVRGAIHRPLDAFYRPNERWTAMTRDLMETWENIYQPDLLYLFHCEYSGCRGPLGLKSFRDWVKEQRDSLPTAFLILNGFRVFGPCHPDLLEGIWGPARYVPESKSSNSEFLQPITSITRVGPQCRNQFSWRGGTNDQHFLLDGEKVELGGHDLGPLHCESPVSELVVLLRHRRLGRVVGHPFYTAPFDRLEISERVYGQSDPQEQRLIVHLILDDFRLDISNCEKVFLFAADPDRPCGFGYRTSEEWTPIIVEISEQWREIARQEVTEGWRAAPSP